MRITIGRFVTGYACAIAIALVLTTGCNDPATSATGRAVAAVSVCPTWGSAGGDGDAGVGFPVNIPDPPATPPPPVTGGSIQITNKCDIPLVIQTEGPDGRKNFMLATGATQAISPGVSWPGGWVEAHSGTPLDSTTLLERIEITPVRGTMWSKVEYFNGIALPIELYSSGTGDECNKRVGCFVPRKKIMTECPDGLLVGQKCLAPGVYCADPANQAKPVCHALDSQIAACAANPACGTDAAAMTSQQAYNCDKFFGTEYKWCAAINRGMLDNPDSTDGTLFYKKAPYNRFAAWFHSFCHSWAFPYDDFNSPPADDTLRTCRGDTGASITFCPAG